MRVLTIYAHHDPRSFCHTILERFTEGLHDAGHVTEVVDLYAIGFDPVYSERDSPDWVDNSVPDDVLAHWHLKESLTAGARIHCARFWSSGGLAIATTATSSANCTRWARRVMSPSSKRRLRGHRR